MEKVLKDESLKQYRGKFPTKPKEPISRNYSCHTPYIPKDSTALDSTAISTEELTTDEIPVDEVETTNE